MLSANLRRDVARSHRRLNLDMRKSPKPAGPDQLRLGIADRGFNSPLAAKHLVVSQLVLKRLQGLNEVLLIRISLEGQTAELDESKSALTKLVPVMLQSRQLNVPLATKLRLVLSDSPLDVL